MEAKQEQQQSPPNPGRDEISEELDENEQYWLTLESPLEPRQDGIQESEIPRRFHFLIFAWYADYRLSANEISRRMLTKLKFVTNHSAILRLLRQIAQQGLIAPAHDNVRGTLASDQLSFEHAISELFGSSESARAATEASNHKASNDHLRHGNLMLRAARMFDARCVRGEKECAKAVLEELHKHGAPKAKRKADVNDPDVEDVGAGTPSQEEMLEEFLRIMGMQRKSSASKKDAEGTSASPSSAAPREPPPATPASSAPKPESAPSGATTARQPEPAMKQPDPAKKQPKPAKKVPDLSIDSNDDLLRMLIDMQEDMAQWRAGRETRAGDGSSTSSRLAEIRQLREEVEQLMALNQEQFAELARLRKAAAPSASTTPEPAPPSTAETIAPTAATSTEVASGTPPHNSTSAAAPPAPEAPPAAVSKGPVTRTVLIGLAWLLIGLSPVIGRRLDFSVRRPLTASRSLFADWLPIAFRSAPAARVVPVDVHQAEGRRPATFTAHSSERPRSVPVVGFERSRWPLRRTGTLSPAGPLTSQPIALDPAGLVAFSSARDPPPSGERRRALRPAVLQAEGPPKEILSLR